jgi:hypothetical protein
MRVCMYHYGKFSTDLNQFIGCTLGSKSYSIIQVVKIFVKKKNTTSITEDFYNHDSSINEVLYPYISILLYMKLNALSIILHHKKKLIFAVLCSLILNFSWLLKILFAISYSPDASIFGCKY